MLSRVSLRTTRSVLKLIQREARQSATTLKAGQTVLLKGKLYTILKASHSLGTARQIGNVQLELKDLKTNTKHHERLRTSAEVEVAFLESSKWNVLYTEGSEVALMNPSTYEQIFVDRRLFGGQEEFLDSGIEATVGYYEGEAVQASIPIVVQVKVEEIEDVVQDGTRVVTLSTGKSIRLPAFINKGDTISINTKDQSFIKRINQ